jgi:UDP-N-acetylmuramoyl-L-alanyl-D-glutamate--2,6-diaminopimelate ligase
VRVPGRVLELESPLFGAHNVENLLVALGVIVALGLDLDRAVRALGEQAGVPGRLERCEAPGDDIVVLVDYAHTPDALARALAAVRALSTGRVFAVFGCGGDRDRMKRGPMGEVAARGADVAIVTNDNPRSEVPGDIAEAVNAGLRAAGMPSVTPADLATAPRGFTTILDRASAIDAAVIAACPGDTVVVCGKGHETYQETLGERRPFDDRVEVRRALARRREEAARPAPKGG